MKDPRDPRNQEPEEMILCKCGKCKDHIGYERQHMFDPDGLAISRWCATLSDLEYFQNIGSITTNAEFELQHMGAEKFYATYFNAPLEPFITPDQVDELFDEIAQMNKP